MKCGQDASNDVSLRVCLFGQLLKTKTKQKTADCDSENGECLQASTSHRDSVRLYLNVAFIPDPAQPTLYPECILKDMY